MGSGISAALVTIGTDTGRGQRLRQLFGGYRGQDIWAILRKLKSMDDGHGFLGFDEVQDLLYLKAPSMLFLWDIFSQQNELFAAKELLTVCCVFSSALLEEKARFLHAVFDASGRGLGTGSEVAAICLMVLSVLGKVTGAVAKAKDVTPQLMMELEELVPPYAEAVQLLGSKEAFQNERVIGQLEIDRILTPSIRDAYESLPLHLDPLPETEPPPPPGWASIGRAGGAPLQSGAERVAELRAEKPLTWLKRTANEEEEVPPEALHRWLLIQNHEFASIAKDLPEFRQVLNVTNGSILVEFLLRPRPARCGDSRTAFELSMLLDKQLNSPYSALRRGALGKFLGSALLLSASPQTVADPELTGIEEESAELKLPVTLQSVKVQTNTLELGTPRPALLRSAAASGACTRQEQEDAQQRLREALRQLQDARSRQLKARAAEEQTLKEIQARDLVIAQLRAELE